MGFGVMGDRSLVIPIALAIGFYNSLYYCAIRDNVLVFNQPPM